MNKKTIKNDSELFANKLNPTSLTSPTTNFITNVPVPTQSLKLCPETIQICETVLRHLGSESAARKHLNIRPSTWSTWKKRSCEFANALLRGREDHVKYTLKDHTGVKLTAVRTWEKMLTPQKRTKTRTVQKRLEDEDGNPLTVTRDGEEVGVYEATKTEDTYWIEPNLKAIQQAMGTDNIETFVLERFGTEYLDATKAIVVQMLGTMVETTEMKSAPEIMKHLLAPEVDIMMIRKMQVINEVRLETKEITNKEYSEIGLALTKAAIDANIKIEMKRKAPFGNKSYATVSADYRNLSHQIINVFREAIEDDRIERDQIIDHIYTELRERDEAGSILGAIIRGEPKSIKTGSEDTADSSRPEDG